MEEKMRNTNGKKTKKKAGYGIKIAMVAGLGTLLICGVVAIGILLFSDLFSFGSTNYKQDYTMAGNHNTGGEITGDIGEPVDGKSLQVSYVGPQLYAKGQAVADNFIVQVVDENGNATVVNDAKCMQLNSSSRLIEGDNEFVFTYKGMSASVTVNAVNIRTLMYAPDYVLTKVDADAAKAKADQITSGQISCNDALSNVAFTGDSQIKALATYAVITEDRIVAKVGESYDYFDENFNRVLEIASGKDAIIVHYGINTLNASADVRAQRIAQYKDILTRLKESLPNVRIIVSGVYPVANAISSAQERFWYINEYDFALCEMCMDLGIEYLSDNEYMDAHQEVFSTDGLHLTKQFYTGYWLANAVQVMGL